MFAKPCSCAWSLCDTFPDNISQQKGMPPVLSLIWPVLLGTSESESEAELLAPGFTMIEW